MSGNERLRMLLYADDIGLFCEDVDELNNIPAIYDETFSQFGSTIVIYKTQPISFNVPEDAMKEKSWLTLRNEPIENIFDMFYQMKTRTQLPSLTIGLQVPTLSGIN